MHQTAVALSPEPLVLGRYRPLRPLGSGGSGSVWLARDERSGLEVALKIIPREGKAAARAEREALAASRLRHERCLRAYALAHDDAHVYIAYEYVPGRTVREALRAGELPDAEAIEAAAQILEGLAHAHAHGIVHRDVKPSNVLLADGHGVSVRLLDFGLAQMEDADTLTAFGDVPGTLAYIAPERLAGDPASAAADVYAVGVLLWEALAGMHPFWKSGLLESAKAIRAGAPPLASVRPDLPRPLLAAVDAALALDPAARPAAAHLADVLRDARRRRKPERRTLPAAPPALAAPIFPLGNVSLGLAVAYAAVASAWFALFAREPRWALLPAVGPLLGPVGALPLLPLLVRPLRSPLRRAAAAAAAVGVAGAAAGVRGTPLPLTGADPPLGLGLAGSDDAGAVARALVEAAGAHPHLVLPALVLAAAAAALPYAEARGRWGVAAFGGGLLAALLLPAPAISALPVVACVWLLCAAVAARTAS